MSVIVKWTPGYLNPTIVTGTIEQFEAWKRKWESASFWRRLWGVDLS